MGRWGQRRCERLCRNGAICSFGDTGKMWKDSEGMLGCGELATRTQEVPGEPRGEVHLEHMAGPGDPHCCQRTLGEEGPQAVGTPKQAVGDCRGRQQQNLLPGGHKTQSWEGWGVG